MILLSKPSKAPREWAPSRSKSSASYLPLTAVTQYPHGESSKRVLDLQPGKKYVDKLSRRQNDSILRKLLISTVSTHPKFQHDHGQQTLIFCLMPLVSAAKSISTLFVSKCAYACDDFKASKRPQAYKFFVSRWARDVQSCTSVVSAKVCDFFFPT